MRDGRKTFYRAVLACCLLAYFLFHAVRAELSRGVFRGSFPSFMVPPALFSVAGLTPGIEFPSTRNKLWIQGATTVVAAAWLEGVTPLFYARATGDWRDVAAMAAGAAAFFLLDALAGRLSQGT